MTPIRFRRVSSLFATSVILFFVGILLFVALLNGQRDLIVLSILVFGMMGGLKLWAKFSSNKIQCGLALEKKRVFAGDTLSLKARAENRKFLPVCLEVEVPVIGSLSTLISESPLVGQGTLLWHQMTDFQWEFAAATRGIYEIGPSKVFSGDLFGFFQKVRETGKALEAVVYPRLVPLGLFSVPRRDFFGTPGGESPVDDPVYILGTTDYQNGRPAKFIHWKASARHHRLQEKVFESTEQEKILLIVDVDQFVEAQAEDAFESILEVVASMAVRLDNQGCALGLFTNGVTRNFSPVVSISRSPQQLSDILEALARLKMEQREAFIDMLRAYEIPWGTSCFYFTLKEDPAVDAVKAHFRRRKIPILSFTFKTASALRRDIPVDADSVFSAENVLIMGA